MKRTLGDLRGDRPDVDALPVREDVRLEMESHVAMETEALIAQGLSEADAREEALRRFGAMREYAREAERHTRAGDRRVRRARTWANLRQDVRYALRRLGRSPAFAALAVATLALGIGANTAVFSLVEGILLSPLPYAEPEDLVALEEEHAGGRPGPIPWSNHQDWRAQTRSLEAMATYGTGDARVSGADEPTRSRVAVVSEDFFPLLGVAPLRGRTTLPDDHRMGAAPVAVISHGFWQRTLGGRENAMGTVLGIRGQAVEIVGVMPPSFDFPAGTEIWTAVEPTEPSTDRTAHNHSGLGRLADGVSRGAADDELDAITQRMAAGFDPESFDAVGAVVTPLKDSLTGATQRPLALLMGASLLVLLVACVNLGGTLLARGAARSTEMAVRASLGAGRGRLLRQLLTESLVLAVAGGAAGVAVAAGIVTLATRLGADRIPRMAEVGVDGRVLVFAVLVGVVTGVACGVVPALRQVGGVDAGALRSGDRHGGAPAAVRTWRILIGLQVATAFCLLVGAGLLVRSMTVLRAQDTGVRTDRTLMVELAPDRTRITTLEEAAAWFTAVRAEAAELPNLTAVGIATGHPATGGMGNGTVELDGDLSREAYGWYVAASPGYLEALGVPLLGGRLFDERDRMGNEMVALVSEQFAREAWPDQDPVGRQVTGGGMDNFWQERPFARVVGVVGDVRYRALGLPPEPVVYFPLAQRPFRARGGATLVAEARSEDLAAAATELQALLRRIDPGLVPQVRPLAAELDRSIADRRFTTLVLGAFSGVALLLALVGIYGVVSYRVTRRTHEMGVRMALGARQDQVLGLVLREALSMVVGGLVIGVLAAWVGTSLLRSLLFGVGERDPASFLVALPVLVVGALVAAWVPARRALRVDPVDALRME